MSHMNFRQLDLDHNYGDNISWSVLETSLTRQPQIGVFCVSNVSANKFLQIGYKLLGRDTTQYGVMN